MFINAKGNRNKLDTIYQYAPNFVVASLPLKTIILNLKNILQGFVDERGTNEETAVLKLLKGLLLKTASPDQFLNLLLTPFTNKQTVLEQLFYKIDDKGGTPNFTILVKFIYAVWETSSYAKFNENNLKKDDGPIFLPYKSEKILGFFSSNTNVKFNKQNIDIELTKILGYKIDTAHKRRVPITETLNYTYHPYQLIYLSETLKETTIKTPKLIPAFFLYAIENIAFWSNTMTSIEYGADILATFSGIGNIAKFRHLKKLTKVASAVNKGRQTVSVVAKLKLAVGFIEIASGTVNAMIRISSTNSKFALALQEYLFYLELLSLSGELTVAIKNGLRKSAKEALAQQDDILKLQNNTKNVEEITEIENTLKHLNEVAELDYLAKWDDLPVSGKGYLGAKILRRKEIKKWINDIKTVSKGQSELIVLPKKHKLLQGNRAGFNPFNGNIYVQKGLTDYEIFHEFKHLEEYIKIGKKEYLKGHKSLGSGLEQNLIRTYKREMYVYNEILKQKNKFSKIQLEDAKNYIDTIVNKGNVLSVDLTIIKI